MLEALRALVAIPSVSGAPAEPGMPYGKQVHDALEKALSLCDEMGFRTKNCNDHLGYAEIGEGDEMMGILVHLDVVPPGNDWETNPYECTMIDGKLYGRGVVDDKGPAVAAMYAMKDILDSGRPLARRVRLIFGCQEEEGDCEDITYYLTHEEKPVFGFTPDANFPAIYGEKGILQVSMKMDAAVSGFQAIHGGETVNMVADHCRAVLDDGTVLETKGRAAHASMPEDGVNAITALMVKAAGYDCPFARFYMDTIGWQLDGTAFGVGLEDRASGALTFSVGTIDRVDDQIVMQVDIRYPVTFGPDEVMERLQRTAERYGVSVTQETWLKPVYMDMKGPIITKLMEAYHEVTDSDVPPLVIGGGTYARMMDHIVAFGPLFPGRESTEHIANEYIYWEDLLKAREIYRSAIEKLACK